MRKLIPILLVVALVACRKERLVASAPARQAQRMIVRTASISMIVDDTAGSIDKITAAAESVGGLVSDSKVWRDGEQLRGSITLRVPSDRLSAALAVVRKMAVRINSESIVTREYVDLATAGEL